jgi:uncharacterized membrane protein HdeD (DUF308 family)
VSVIMLLVGYAMGMHLDKQQFSLAALFALLIVISVSIECHLWAKRWLE